MMLHKVIDLRGTHNRFLDALKGYAILFVLINHGTPLYIKQLTLFDLWGGMAVPLFLIIQVFHYFKYGLDKIKPIKWKGLFFKLVCPFVIAEALIISIQSFTQHIPLIECIVLGVKNWGYGPGEYYIWEYFQFLLLCTILPLLCGKLSNRSLCLFSIAISIGLELLADFMHISEHAYKFLFFRYFFLIYLGYQWALNNVVLNRKTLLLSFISIIFIIAFDYTDIDLSPLFYDTSWKCFHWISYFYPAYLMIFILHFVYKRIGHHAQRILEALGRNSWVIFCVQLVVYSFLSPDSFSFIDSVALRGAIYFISGIISSIVPVMIVKSLNKRFARFIRI